MRSRWLRTAALTAALGVGMVVVAWFTMVVLPSWAVGSDTAHMTAAERQNAKSSARDSAIKLIGGLSTLLVAGFGIERHFLDKDKQRLEHDKQRLDNDKHLTGQFDDATTHLVATEPNERANGVRTLFRLMGASPTDHMLVVPSLCDMLRHYAIADSSRGHRLPADLTAGVRALRDRPRRPEAEPLDLAGVHLPGSDWHGTWLHGVYFADAGGAADLTGANFTGADLSAARCAEVSMPGTVLREANLSEADFTDADLDDADLSGADASGAHMSNTRLRNADLRGTRLCGTRLRRARLSGARLGSTPDAPDSVTDLTGADLDEADLTGVDLRAVHGLTDAAIRTAIVDSGTKLPAGVRHPRLAVSE